MQAAALTTEEGLLGEASLAPSSRIELVRRLVDVLALPAGRMTANERAFAADILGAVLSDVPLALRVEVAERLASVGVAPPALLRQLVLDGPAVATPLLRALTEVPEAVLIEAAGVTAEHALAACEREGVTSGLAEALLARGERHVTRLVLGMDHVVLTAPRVEALMQRSRNDVPLRRALLARPELQPRQGFAMFWWCEAGVRARILQRFSIDRSEVQDALQPLFAEVFTDDAPDPLVKRMLTLIDRRHRPRGKNGEMVTMEVVERTLAVARAAPSLELCEAVGLLAGVSTETATQVMYDAGGEPFSVLAKSIGLSRSAFIGVLEGAAAMPTGDGPTFDEAQQERLVAAFDTIARDYSRTILRYWDWRAETTGLAAPAPAALTAEPAEEEPGGYLGAV